MKNILVLSYYTNIPGSCQAEWVDDRMRSFIKEGYKITIISATCCFTHEKKNIQHFKIPALSPHAASYEYKERIRNNIPVAKDLFYIYTWVMRYVDSVFSKIGISSGEGRWTWTLPALMLCLIRVKNKMDIDFIYSTGGPPSAHLAGIMFAKIFRKKIIVEFQDPLSGEDIGRNKISAIGLRFFEKWIINYSTVAIYCTQNAMKYARNSYPSLASKIDFVYPGSRAYENLEFSSLNSQSIVNGNIINISYLGTLYQTRNIDTLMAALDQLINEGSPTAFHIKIYGAINQDIKDRILKFPHHGIISMHGLVTRDEALKKALEADILLIVQHSDKRSITTMPFKTYDYLNTGKLVFGLIYKNDEIEEILSSHGHIACQVDDIASIKEKLIHIYNNFPLICKLITRSSITPKNATDRMIELLN
jgi:glycosyltransferase involved in cell wall biosynthesis